jgi:excisionase family DNA binding protein
MTTPKYLTVKETAELLRLSETTVRNKVNLKIFKKGKHYVRQPGIGLRFKEEALIAWLEGTEEKPKEEKDKETPGVVIPMARGYNMKLV